MKATFVLIALFSYLTPTTIVAAEGTSTARGTASTATKDGGEFSFGLGWATYGVGGFEAPSSSALSMLLMFNDNHSLQFLFGISSVDSFTFGAGMGYRGRLASKEWVGLHLGGILNVGNWTQSINFQIGPVLGIQIRPVRNLLFMVEGGPILSVAEVGGTVDANFRVGSLFDGMLGLSIHYLL